MRQSFTFISGIAIASAFFLGLGMQTISGGPTINGGGGAYAISGDVREFLQHVSMVDLPDGQGGFVRAARLSGLNFQIVNGLGSTDTINGTGNLIVGYNETGNPFGDYRLGSHNIEVGARNNYHSYGGLVAGDENTVSGEYSSVSGGVANLASGRESAVSGGLQNEARGMWSSISGGSYNFTYGDRCSVSGGFQNRAFGVCCSILGGQENDAYMESSTVAGGHLNAANGKYTSILGGYHNYTIGEASCISGGRLNGAAGIYSSVSGGFQRSTDPTGAYDWVAGTLHEDQ